jgi:hypothetical protein
MPFFQFNRDSLAPTFFGWTPGLRSVAGGRVLACGCLAGTYYTWRGDTVVILDAPGPACANPHHRAHLVLWRGAGLRAAVPLEEPSSYADTA